MLKVFSLFVGLFGDLSWKKEFDLVDLGKMDVKQTWEDWKLYFNKNYNTNEEFTRFGIFIESLQKIATMNSGGFETARFALNQFSDLTPDGKYNSYFITQFSKRQSYYLFFL